METNHCQGRVGTDTIVREGLGGMDTIVREGLGRQGWRGVTFYY